MIMKRTIMTLAAVLCCAMTTAVLTACTNDNIDTPAVTDLAEKIVGKWMLADMNGQPCPTNDKIVQTFLSATKVTESLSRTNYSDDTDKWHTSLEGTCSIEGSTVTMTFLPEDGVTTTCILNVQSITSTEMVASTKRTTIDNGRTVYEQEAKVRMVKVGADQSQAILGMWEGRMTSEQSEYGDVEDHRWEFLLDGTFNFFRKVDGQWQISDDDYADYFVDGNLLCTRWKNAGAGNEEHREWWEIESIENGVMKWKALRQKEDGSTYTATFEMKKVEVPSQAEVEQKIIGKWMIAERDGQPALTNEKEVFNFISTTEAYLSASLNFHPDAATPWYDIIEADVVIEGNKVTLTMHPDEHTISVREFTITAINENEFTANHEVTVTKDGNIVLNEKVLLTLAKVKVDYSADIIGMWEGRMTSEQSVYGDVEDHRWEYMTDGTFNFFRKVDDQWQISDDDFSDYFVAGNLLCTRWKNAGEGNEENREWWEIESIENGVMKWKSLRQKEDGTTYTATFEMTKVN
jgi:hypothetical protein